jgi:DNA-binding XRE family transcriptional regulator
MSKRSDAIDAMPPTVLVSLRELGGNLSIARKRRREPRKLWADRIGVSEPTLARMEKGDPSVSMGVYATALWLMDRAAALSQLAAPEHDLGALEDAVRAAQTRAGRKRPALGIATASALMPRAPKGGA